MKIFSSFDTKLKKKYLIIHTAQYGKENIFVISRSKLYYYYKVILRIIYGMILQIGVSFSLYHVLGGNYMMISILLGLIFGLVLYIIALENYLDYSMNYAIFTPEEAILVEQIGIFNRNIKSLDIRKIKGINIRKSNVFFSIFNDGLITITSDTNDPNLGEIRFKYVHNPEGAKNKIQDIISKSHNHGEIHNNI